jgi:hypothetical protein
LYLSPKSENPEKVEFNGQTITASGANGPFYDQGESAMAGLYGRKWLNPDPAFVAAEGNRSNHLS